MTIYVTASGNFDNKKSWSGLKKHLKHDEAVHHKNKYLELDQSKLDRKFNQHLVLENFDDFFVRAIASSTDYLANIDTLNIMFEPRDQQKQQKQQNNNLDL